MTGPVGSSAAWPTPEYPARMLALKATQNGRFQSVSRRGTADVIDVHTIARPRGSPVRWCPMVCDHGSTPSDRRNGAPVDHVLAPGDRCGAIRGEEGDELRDLCRPARAAERNPAK